MGSTQTPSLCTFVELLNPAKKTSSSSLLYTDEFKLILLEPLKTESKSKPSTPDDFKALIDPPNTSSKPSKSPEFIAFPLLPDRKNPSTSTSKDPLMEFELNTDYGRLLDVNLASKPELIPKFEHGSRFALRFEPNTFDQNAEFVHC